MALPQEIQPVHQAPQDSVTRALEPWMEQSPLSAMKIL